jgi:hypothetical protein
MDPGFATRVRSADFQSWHTAKAPAEHDNTACSPQKRPRPVGRRSCGAIRASPHPSLRFQGIPKTTNNVVCALSGSVDLKFMRVGVNEIRTDLAGRSLVYPEVLVCILNCDSKCRLRREVGADEGEQSGWRTRSANDGR